MCFEAEGRSHDANLGAGNKPGRDAARDHRRGRNIRLKLRLGCQVFKGGSDGNRRKRDKHSDW